MRILLVSAFCVLSQFGFAQDAQRSVKDVVLNSLKAEGFSDEDLGEIALSVAYDSHNGKVTHSYFEQRYQGVRLFNADIAVHTLSSGDVLFLTHNAQKQLSKRVKGVSPALSALGALTNVLQREQEYSFQIPDQVDHNAAQKQFVFAGEQFSNESVKVQLMLVPTVDDIILAWEVSYYLPDGSHWWNVRVDANTGQELGRNDWVVECAFGNDNHGCHDHDAHIPEMASAPASPNDYNVFALPEESPNHGARSLQNAPWNNALNASPFGWHDNDGIAGAENTTTIGNNVYAQEDRNANNGVDGHVADGGVDLDFDFPIDFSLEPITYEDAAITNLFYWNNVLHDVLYQYGFDEPSGNFQDNTYGNGGAGGDFVWADAQDGSGFNNANFGTPNDGSSPRMQMFLWSAPTPDKDGDLDNGIIAHEYGHGWSNRLVGGPNNTSCLFNAEQMGEGWSDFLGLILTMKPSDTRTDSRGIGTFALDQAVTGPGIRPAPYSTDFSVNNYTYNNTNFGVSQPHGIGFVWCTMLWELTWDLIDEHGFDADIYNGTGGNNIAFQLVSDGLKLTACQPGFVDGRDAILQADQLNNGGANFDLIWGAFARRGLGFSANQGTSTSRSDQSEAFDLPVDTNLRVANIYAPVAGVLLECNNAPFNVSVEIGNGGLTDQSAIPVAYRIDGGAIVQETLAGPIVSGGSTTFTFSVLESISSVGAHSVQVWTAQANDAYPSDDTLLIAFDLIPDYNGAYPILEDFEAQALCATNTDCGGTICPLVGPWFNLVNGAEDDIDWRVNSGTTASTATGPSVDFDPGTATGQYIYLEASGTCDNQVAILNSPCLDVTALTVPALSFAYHMYGVAMGSLAVDVFDGTTWNLNVFVTSGDLGDQWLREIIDLTPFANSGLIGVRFRGITSNSFESDMALDAISIFDATIPPVVDFEASQELICGNATVVFTDLSLLSPTAWNWSITPNTFTFANGTNANSQNPEVLFATPGIYDVQLDASNAYGSDVRLATGLISVSGGNTPSGIEDFEAEGLCNTTGDCESTLCPLSGAWVNEQNGSIDDVDWRVNEGSTPSSGTGPDFDFTEGTNVGNYIYLETSGSCVGQEAHLVSECLDISNFTLPTLSFAYHMDGQNMGELHLDVFQSGVWTNDIMPVISGNQGNQWFSLDVDLSTWSNALVNLRLRGVTGSGFESDLALDGLNVVEGAAAPTADFTASPDISCGNVVQLNDLSTLNPTSWNWTITPNSFAFVNGTSATSENPEIILNAAGNYTIVLDASNSYGVGSVTKVDVIGSLAGDPLELTVTTDAFPNEITWQLLDLGANVIATGGPYVSSGVQPTEYLCVPDSNCFVLEFNDSFGDGIFVPGGYVLKNSTGDTLVYSDGGYGTQQVDTFCFVNPLLLDLRAFLGGPFDGLGQMSDDLRVAATIPGTEPYTALGYTHIGSGGEILAPQLLTIGGVNAIVDWVMVELRDPSDPSIILFTYSGIIDRAGNVLSPEGKAIELDAPVADYYIAIRHRNHLGCMTASAIALNSASASLVDFTLPATLTWGVNARQLSGASMVLWAGNVNSDPALKYVGVDNDRDPILVRIGGNSPTTVVSGYFNEDINMDNDVKYVGTNNDRDPILVNIGGNAPTTTVQEQLP